MSLALFSPKHVPGTFSRRSVHSDAEACCHGSSGIGPSGWPVRAFSIITRSQRRAWIGSHAVRVSVVWRRANRRAVAPCDCGCTRAGLVGPSSADAGGPHRLGASMRGASKYSTRIGLDALATAQLGKKKGRARRPFFQAAERLIL